MSDLESVALRIRHEAALAVLRDGETAPEGWRLLAAVVAPSETFREVSERRARELLERAAA